MRIDLNGNSEKLSSLKVSHLGEETFWNVIIYERTNFSDLASLFKEINGYWASLDPIRQQEIWNCYQEIMRVLEDVHDPAKLHVRLKNLVKTLYDLHDLDDLRRWVMFHADIKIPANTKWEYGPNEANKERTYLRADYEDLAMLAIALRPMVPILGEYIERVKREAGSNYKEHYAMGLLSASKLQTAPAMQRLRQYIEATVEGNPTSVSAVLSGLGTAELPEWLLSKSVVRRVAIGEVNVTDENASIISNIYHFLITKMGSMDRDFKLDKNSASNGKVNEKRRPSEGADEDNMSLIETYKVKQDVSDGDLVMLSIYTEQIEDMALRVDPELDMAKLQACMMPIFNTRGPVNLQQMAIHPHHLTLTQWVMRRAISARGIPSLNKPALMRAIGVTQALLWHWGFLHLAALMTASPYVVEEGAMMATVDSRVRIPKDCVDQLVGRYPYYQRSSSKSQNERQANVACRAIDALARELTKTDWMINAPAEITKAAVTHQATRMMIVPADVKAQLARLLLRIV